MPPVEPSEDLAARRDELDRRIAELSERETKARAQIIIDRPSQAEAMLQGQIQAGTPSSSVTAKPDAISNQNSLDFKGSVQRSRQAAMARYFCTDAFH